VKIILVEPEIPQNTGNISRTCAATGAELHLIEPLGFSLEEKMVRRAGLDYWHLVTVRTHASLDAFIRDYPDLPLFFLSTKAKRLYTEAVFPEGCGLVFGKESAGLPEELLRRNPERCIRIPISSRARSLNLANAVAITAFEVLRQNNFNGMELSGTPRSFEWQQAGLNSE
jgi:tRNA (cytidine/uridine-2'-O-)-methyltransferase